MVFTTEPKKLGNSLQISQSPVYVPFMLQPGTFTVDILELDSNVVSWEHINGTIDITYEVCVKEKGGKENNEILNDPELIFALRR